MIILFVVIAVFVALEGIYRLGRSHSGVSESIHTTGSLAQLKSKELARLYQEALLGEIPNGESNGRAIILPGSLIGKLLSMVANTVWKGKVFDRSSGTLVNKLLGLRFVKAEVACGSSWSDDKQSVIIDYLRTSLIAFYIRDEIRQLLPGLYLGKAYIRLPFGLHFCALYFALDFRR